MINTLIETRKLHNKEEEDCRAFKTEIIGKGNITFSLAIDIAHFIYPFSFFCTNICFIKYHKTCTKSMCLFMTKHFRVHRQRYNSFLGKQKLAFCVNKPGERWEDGPLRISYKCESLPGQEEMTGAETKHT